MDSEMKLEGRCAIITGASQGLGKAISKQFLQEGASVLICSNNETAITETERELGQYVQPGQRIVSATCNVASPGDMDRFFEKAFQAFSSIQILVNNAGVGGPLGAIEGVNWDEWISAIHVNLLGTVYGCKLIVPHFKAQGYGKIINLSGGGATTPLPGISAYAASKAAVVRFTETLSEELKGLSIDVNAMAPGALKTNLTEKFVAAGPEKIGDRFHDKISALLREGGTPLEVGAECAVYLASGESDGISGKLIAAQWDPWKRFAQYHDALAGTDIYTLRRILPTDRGENWEET